MLFCYFDFPDEPPLEKKKKIPSLLDIKVCPKVSDLDDQFGYFDFPDEPPLEKKKKIPSLFDIKLCPEVSDPDKQESIQKTLKEAARKSV